MSYLESLNVSSNNFSFSFQTSSGDKISLSMYDNQELSLNEKESKNSKTISMSLRHELGYKFSYEGNGISKQDQKEIEEAVKKIKPIYKKFINNIKDNNLIPNDKEILKWTNLAKQELPKMTNNNKLNMLKDKTISGIDDVLSIFKRNEEIIKATSKFFDKLFEQSKFDYYA